MLDFQEIKDKQQWNKFIESNDFSFYSFLQSWEWGEVQKGLGKDLIRVGFFKDSIQIGCALILKISAKRGRYFFIPHGPLILKEREGEEKIYKDFFSYITLIAKSEKCSFVRCNSVLKNTIENKKLFQDLGFRDSPMHEHVEDTHILDISLPEEELFSNIKKSDRYYINRALREGVKIRIDNDEDHVNSLIKMHQMHSKRENGKARYTAFSPTFIESLYKHFGENITTISTSYNGKIESILMTIRFLKTSVYYIAASDIMHPKFSPNYLCQWEAIKKAKSDGCSVYNFWGVSPDDNPKHPIAGVTKFKRKFAGEDYSLLHSQDLVIEKSYWINYIIETIRRKKRGYYYKKPS